MTDKQYITQITAEELRKMLAMANVEVGDGISIEEHDGGLTIAIDKTQLKVMMWSFCVRAGVPIGISLYDTYSLSLDPP